MDSHKGATNLRSVTKEKMEFGEAKKTLGQKARKLDGVLEVHTYTSRRPKQQIDYNNYTMS